MKRYFLFWFYCLRNIFTNLSILNLDSQFEISLTTHSKRISKVFATLESIGAGSILPKKITLFLDCRFQNTELPTTLQRLQKRGLDIVFCDDVGPHTKYFPYLLSKVNFDVPLVTADDDIMYPLHWLKRLAEAWATNPDLVNCYRARKIICKEAKLAPYNQWPLCRNSIGSTTNFATGVSGVIYPPLLLKALKQAGDEFKYCCPTNDDVWLHIIAIRSGFKVRQLDPVAYHFPTIPKSSRSALVRTNLDQGQNDVQIEKSYTPEDIFFIKTD